MRGVGHRIAPAALVQRVVPLRVWPAPAALVEQVLGRSAMFGQKAAARLVGSRRAFQQLAHWLFAAQRSRSFAEPAELFARCASGNLGYTVEACRRSR